LHPRFSEPLCARDLAQLAQCSLNADQLKQVKIDLEKDKVANQNGFLIFRVTLDMDIIDIILFIDKNLINTYRSLD